MRRGYDGMDAGCYVLIALAVLVTVVTITMVVAVIMSETRNRVDKPKPPTFINVVQELVEEEDDVRT